MQEEYFNLTKINFIIIFNSYNNCNFTQNVQWCAQNCGTNIIPR